MTCSSSAPSEPSASDDESDHPEPAVDGDRVASRASLRASERRAGSADPAEQAEAILADGDERRREAARERDPDSPTD